MGREGNPLFYPAGRSGASAGGAVRQRLAAQLELAAARLVAAFADPVLHLPALRLARLGVELLDAPGQRGAFAAPVDAARAALPPGAAAACGARCGRARGRWAAPSARFRSRCTRNSLAWAPGAQSPSVKVVRPACTQRVTTVSPGTAGDTRAGGSAGVAGTGAGRAAGAGGAVGAGAAAGAGSGAGAAVSRSSCSASTPSSTRPASHAPRGTPRSGGGLRKEGGGSFGMGAWARRRPGAPWRQGSQPRPRLARAGGG